MRTDPFVSELSRLSTVSSVPKSASEKITSNGIDTSPPPGTNSRVKLVGSSTISGGSLIPSTKIVTVAVAVPKPSLTV